MYKNRFRRRKIQPAWQFDINRVASLQGRSRMLVFGFTLCFLLLAGRALWVQVIDRAFYVREGQKRYEHVEPLLPDRGEIVDRNGHLLALNVPLKTVWVDPQEWTAASQSQRRLLADALGLLPATQDEKLARPGRFVTLKNGVSLERAGQIESLRVPGVHTSLQWQRFYPEDEMAQIIGVVGRSGAGLEGVELASDQALAGTAGLRRTIADRLGRRIDNVSFVPAEDGRHLCVSVDSRIQNLAHRSLRQAVEQNHARSGGVVVLDAQTGELLALANWPAFNPNDRATFAAGVLRNGVLADTFEPGSSIKPVTMALALDRNVVQEATVIDASGGTMRIGASVIHDTSDHGRLTVLQVLQKSSNVGMARIALQLNAQDMATFFSGVGLGHRPDLPLPGVAAGRLRPWRDWQPIEQATMAYGYGISVSLVQLAQAYTAFATDGVFVPATLACHPASSRRVQMVRPATAASVRRALELTVGPGGTARRAAIDGYRVGGKTGTARKQEGRGYARGKYRATFVGMAPMSHPRFIVAVMIDEPAGGSIYGGAVAAPVFADVMRESLRIQQVVPDRITGTPD